MAVAACLILAQAAIASADVAGTTGAVVRIEPPPSVQDHALESNTDIMLFDEFSGVLPEDLTVDISEPGTYNGPDTPGGLVPAGTLLESYYLHTDSVGTTPVELSGSVTFDGIVLGVIHRAATLATSDALLGRPGTAYDGGTGRGMEAGDIVTISDDRRTVSVSQRVGPNRDDLRIIVAARRPSALSADPVLLRISPLKITLGPVTAHLTAAPGSTLAGHTLSFAAGGTPLCSAVTGAQGSATCNLGVGDLLRVVLSGGYTVSFAGSVELLPATARGRLVG